MSIPYRIANGTGNKPDAAQLMANFDWLTVLLFGDFLENGGFEDWSSASSFVNPADGTAIADRWTLRKSGTSTATADVSRNATFSYDGTWAAKVGISVAGSANSLIAFDQNLSQYVKLRGQSVCFGARVRATVGSKVRLKISDGTTTAYSSYHTGSSAYEQLNVVIAVSATASAITVSFEVTSDFTADVYFDNGFAYLIPANMTALSRSFLDWFAALSTGASLTIYGAGNGVIVTTPDGTHTYKIAVDNDGNVTSTLNT